MPATIHDGVEASESVGLEIVVAALVVTTGANDSVSPLATALAALAVSVTVVPVVEDTVPILSPVVTS